MSDVSKAKELVTKELESLRTNQEQLKQKE